MVSGVPVYGRLLLGNPYCLCRNGEASGTSWDLRAAHFLSHKEPPSATFWVIRNCSPWWKVSVPRKLLHCGRDWLWDTVHQPLTSIHICAHMHINTPISIPPYTPRTYLSKATPRNPPTRPHLRVASWVMNTHQWIYPLRKCAPSWSNHLSQRQLATALLTHKPLREVFRFKLCPRRTSCILSLCFVIKHKSAASGPVITPPCRHCRQIQRFQTSWNSSHWERSMIRLKTILISSRHTKFYFYYSM